MKINIKKLVEAQKYIDMINKQEMKDLDFSEVFPKITQEQKDDFRLTGLANTDLVFSNWPENHGIKRIFDDTK